MHQKKLLFHLEGSLDRSLAIFKFHWKLFVLVEPSLLHHTFLLGPLVLLPYI